MITSQQDIKQLGAIMGVWAHPDDETWTSAGIMATARANGQSVAVLSATNGDAGQSADESRWARTSLREIRQQELRNALDAIGVSDLTLLDYPDDKLGDIDDKEAVATVLRHINAVQPDTILTFEPNGITGHTDHKKASAWAIAAAKQLDAPIAVYGAVDTVSSYESVGKKAHELFNVYFATDKPDLYEESDLAICFKLPNEAVDRKRAAFRAHASQTHALLEHQVGKELVEQSVKQECFIKLL